MNPDMNTLIPNEDGIWIECCNPTCKKWRYVLNIDDPLAVPEIWYCNMNSDQSINNCSIPERIELDEDEVFVESKFKAGSIVWAKVIGYPWAPAMVDFCPDFECYYWFDNMKSSAPTKYHVKFFDTKNASRAWLKSNFVKPFMGYDESFISKTKLRGKNITAKQKAVILKNCKIAESALALPLMQRLKKYNFASWKLLQRFKKLTAPAKQGRLSNTLASIYDASDKSRKQTENKGNNQRLDHNSNEHSVSNIKRFKSAEKIVTKKIIAESDILKKSERLLKESTFVTLYESNENDSLITHNVSTSTLTTSNVQNSDGSDFNDTYSNNSIILESHIENTEEQNNSIIQVKLNESQYQKVATHTNEMLLSKEGIVKTVKKEFPMVIPSSPQPKPSQLSLKLKAVSEEKKKSLSKLTSKSLSGNLIKDENKENIYQQSRYARALLEFTPENELVGGQKIEPKRSTTPSSVGQLPEWCLDENKRQKDETRRVYKILSNLSEEEENNLYRENRQSFIAEISALNISNESKKKQLKSSTPSQSYDLLTSDDSF